MSLVARADSGRTICRSRASRSRCTLEPERRLGEYLLGEIGLGVGVQPEVVAVPVGYIAGVEAGERLRAPRGRFGAVLVYVPPLMYEPSSRYGLVGLVAEGGAERQVDRRR